MQLVNAKQRERRRRIEAEEREQALLVILNRRLLDSSNPASQAQPHISVGDVFAQDAHCGARIQAQG